MSSQKFICKHHINEDAIKDFISKNGHKQHCSYCNDSKEKQVVSFEALSDLINDGISYFYVDAAEHLPYESSEGGYLLAKTFNSYDLLFDELSLDVINNDLRKDLVAYIPDNMWCAKDPLGDTESDELYYTWEEFKQIVKHKIRFSFFYIDKIKYENVSFDVSALLRTIIHLMKKHRLIRKLSTDEELFRCRQYSKKEDIKGSSSICSPPKESVTFSNRMSPAGISMFYAGFDLKTAFQETVDKSNRSKFYFTIGSFKLKSKIDIVDFSNTPPIPSVFDQKKRKNYYSLTFLHRFIDDLGQAISRDGQEHIDYVPTQIITEYIRYFFFKSPDLRVGGIVYPSTKVKGANACVLFLNHEESIEALEFQRFNMEHRDLDNISAHLI